MWKRIDFFLFPYEGLKLGTRVRSAAHHRKCTIFASHFRGSFDGREEAPTPSTMRPRTLSRRPPDCGEEAPTPNTMRPRALRVAALGLLSPCRHRTAVREKKKAQSSPGKEWSGLLLWGKFSLCLRDLIQALDFKWYLFRSGSVDKESACNAGDSGLMPGL